MLRSASVAAHRFFVTAAVALAVGAVGCSDRACIRWNQNGDSCPNAVAAKPFFGQCSDIQSIDSNADFVAGNLCCYDVTRTLDGLACKPPAVVGQGGNRTTPSSSDVQPVGETATSGSGGVGGVTNSAGGGGMGGAPNCDALSCGFATDKPITGCLSCAETMLCATQSEACNNSSECLGFEGCIGGCTIADEACVAACKAQFPEGAPIFQMFLECAVCDACRNACASNQVAQLANCNGGGQGGAGQGGAGQGGPGQSLR